MPFARQNAVFGVLLGLVLGACVGKIEIIEGTQCPCAVGFECCPSTLTCQLSCPSPPRDAGFPDAGFRDSGTRDAGERDAGERDAGERDAGLLPVDAGFYDGGALDDIGVPPASIGPWTWSNIKGTTDRRDDFTATWTGREVLMFGGWVGGCASYHDRYNPWTDQWRRFLQATSLSRGGHTAVWTSKDLLVWGGDGCRDNDTTFLDGVRYDPVLQTLTPIADAPAASAFHASVWMGDRLFVYGGRCSSSVTCLDRGVIYEATNDRWVDIDMTGAPQPFDEERTIQWTGTQVLLWGEHSGRYFLGVDAWQPFPEPDFALGVGPSVWTGNEMIVWDGAVGGRFNPRTSTWVETSTINSPTGVALPRAVWTGAEMIVMGTDGGAHYDPTRDTWTPVTPNHAYYAQANSRILWTGRELLAIGSDTITGTHGARYGPRLAGDPSCNGGGPPLQVEIARPTARSIGAGAIDVQASIPDPDFSIQRREWSFDGQPFGQTLTETLDLSLASAGTHVLRFEAEDALGNMACHAQALFIDPPPSISVSAPADEDVADPEIAVRATCDDASPDGCAIRVLVGEVVVASSTSAALVATADLAAFEGTVAELVFEATDRYGQRTLTTRSVYVESNPLLELHAVITGQLCDVSDTRVLFSAADRFVIQNVTTGTTTEVSGVGTIDCASSRLLAPNDAVVRVGSVASYVREGAVSATFTSGGFRVADPWVVNVIGTTIARRRPSTDFVETIGTDPYPAEAYDIAPDGDVVWQDRTGALTFSPRGGVGTMIASLPMPSPFASPLAADSVHVWRRRHMPNEWSFEIFDETTTTILQDPYLDTVQGPRRESAYRAAGGFVAFEVPDLTGALQVWLRAPTGTPQIATGFADPTQIEGLSANGDIIYSRGGRLVHRDFDTGGTIELGGSAGQVLERDGRWFVRYGRTIFRVVLP